jgi:class 3 adenylate cyclase
VVAESVELATILLTDLVGSTRLANSVGPVRADELREEHFELLRDAIAVCSGREVKSTGDGLMVAFASASAAVECAVAMQQRFERRYRQAEQALHVRIGLGAGESTVKDGDYFGMPSIEAARLCAQAPSDGILVSALVGTLAGRCEGIEFHSVGGLELKGFERPVEVLSVSWAPLAEETGGASRWPLPALLRSVPPLAYVGRVAERAALEEAMTLARSGQCQVMLLSGEPGIGKTRLASYAAHHAHAEGFAVCWGACTEELAVPYEPWIGVCTQLVESAPDELLVSHVKRHGGELARVARNLGERVDGLPELQSSDPETERYLLFSAVVGLLEQVVQSAPVCLVLDDLHWADAQSLALLKHLLRALEQGSLQLIATFRDSDLGKEHPLSPVLADLRSLQGGQRITLHGLGADEVVEFVTAIGGHELDAHGLALAAQIAEETDGNPFFVGEMLRGLSESGALVFDRETSRWSVEGSAIVLPVSVREVIERRVERLGQQAVEVLTLAAVIGRSFELELLSAIVAMDQSALLDELEEAVRAAVLAESSERIGRFRFVHALINQTLYDGLGPTRRAQMHQRVGEALEELYGQDPREHLAELALHWRLAAVSVDKAKAADYAMRAGRQALENLAPGEAVKLFSDAVELTGDSDSPSRCEALVGLGLAQLQAGEPAHRETLLEASRIASELGDADLAARAALANSRGYASVVGERDDERVAAIARATELDEPPNPVRRAQLLALQALEVSWDVDLARRRALVDEALALARGAGDVCALAAVLVRAWQAIWSPETLELRREFCSEAADCAATLGDPALAFWAQSQAVISFVEHGDLAQARNADGRAHAIAEELGQPTLLWFDCFMRAARELVRGDLVAGERLAEQAFKLGQEAGEPDAVLIYGAQITFVRLYQGRGQEIIEMHRQAATAFEGVPSFRAGLASTLCWLELHDEARGILEQAASDRFEHVGDTATTLATLASYADVAFLASDPRAAAMLYERLEPFAEQVAFNAAYGLGHVRLWLGLLAAVLGEHQRADEHLQFACEFHRANDMPLWAARGQLGLAQALVARDDPATARDHAAHALELSREHGYALFEPRAAALVTTASAAGA